MLGALPTPCLELGTTARLHCPASATQLPLGHCTPSPSVFQSLQPTRREHSRMKPSADLMSIFIINPYEGLGEHHHGTFWVDFTPANNTF